MLGIDIVRISRFEGHNATLLERILHPNELKLYHTSQFKNQFLAARFAIKEALYKADNRLFHFNRIEIQKINDVYCYPGFTISTSSEDDYYIAIVWKGNSDENQNSR